MVTKELCGNVVNERPMAVDLLPQELSSSRLSIMVRDQILGSTYC
jgi:hypothetical protein